jgi:tryptophan synthase
MFAPQIDISKVLLTTTLDQIALKNNVEYCTVLALLRDSRSKGLTVPVILMGGPPHHSSQGQVLIDLLSGYYNPLLAYGEDRSIQDAVKAGANGFIMVDLPPEEAKGFRQKCASAKSVFRALIPTKLTFSLPSLSYVPLIAPSTSLSRIKFLASIADTFIYIVSKVNPRTFYTLETLLISADGHHGILREGCHQQQTS